MASAIDSAGALEAARPLLGTAVIVLNWNGAPDTIACVESVLRSTAGGFGVVIVDNGSTDNSVIELGNWLKGRVDKVVGPRRRGGHTYFEGVAASSGIPIALVLNQSNQGYAAGNNAGMDVAASWRAGFVWILNNDVTVEPDALARLEGYAVDHPKVGAVGCLMVEAGRPEEVQAYGGGRYVGAISLNLPLGHGMRRSDVSSWSQDEARLDYISGASLFGPLERIMQVGGFPERYFLFCEEVELARRLLQAGWLLGVEPRAVVHHRGATSSGAHRDLSMKTALATYHGSRSALLLTRRNWPHYLPTVLIARIGYALILLLRRRDLGFAAISGAIAGLGWEPDVK